MLIPSGAQASCRDQWASLNDLLTRTGLLEAARPGIVRQGAIETCRIDGVNFPTRDRLTIETRSIVWRGEDMSRFVEQGLPPRALTLEIDEINVVPDFGNPGLTYLNRLQQQGQGIDLNLSVRWDEDTLGLSAETVLLFPGDDAVAMSAQASGVDLSTEAALQLSVGRFAVTEAEIDVRSTRLFVDYFLQPLGGAVLYNADDPEARVEELKILGLEWLDGVPDTILASASKSALRRLIADMPTPAGRLHLKTTADPGVGPARFLPLALSGVDGPQDIWRVLDGVAVDVNYQLE